MWAKAHWLDRHRLPKEPSEGLAPPLDWGAHPRTPGDHSPRPSFSLSPITNSAVCHRCGDGFHAKCFRCSLNRRLHRPGATSCTVQGSRNWGTTRHKHPGGNTPSSRQFTERSEVSSWLCLLSTSHQRRPERQLKVIQDALQ